MEFCRTTQDTRVFDARRTSHFTTASRLPEPAARSVVMRRAKGSVWEVVSIQGCSERPARFRRKRRRAGTHDRGSAFADRNCEFRVRPPREAPSHGVVPRIVPAVRQKESFFFWTAVLRPPPGAGISAAGVEKPIYGLYVVPNASALQPPLRARTVNPVAAVRLLKLCAWWWRSKEPAARTRPDETEQTGKSRRESDPYVKECRIFTPAFS
jgi:hypothetical protein